MQTAVALQWNAYVECGMHICSGAYANNVECIHISVPCHIVDFSALIQGIYSDIFGLYLHKNTLAYVAYA